jgi:hypothetical protein
MRKGRRMKERKKMGNGKERRKEERNIKQKLEEGDQIMSHHASLNEKMNRTSRLLQPIRTAKY